MEIYQNRLASAVNPSVPGLRTARSSLRNKILLEVFKVAETSLKECDERFEGILCKLGTEGSPTVGTSSISLAPQAGAPNEVCAASVL